MTEGYDKFLKIEKKIEQSPKEHPDFGRICLCMCHVEEVDVFCSCFVQCCRFEQKKYFDRDGNFDVGKFGALIIEERLLMKGKKNGKRNKK